MYRSPCSDIFHQNERRPLHLCNGRLLFACLFAICATTQQAGLDGPTAIGSVIVPAPKA